MSARVVVLGFDAAEATDLERWAAEGHLPTLARLTERATRARLANCLDTLPGAIWPELATGVSGGRSGLFFHPRQLHTGEGRVRPVTADEVDPEQQWWVAAARAGRRVAALDVPQSVPAPDVDGLQLFEWGLHDRQFATASEPAELLADVRARWGDHPVQSCDRAHGGTVEGYRELLAGLVAGARAKGELAAELVGRDDWDLVVCCWAESHCVGHQFHHLADPDDPRHPADAPDDLRHATRTVYAEMDAAAGRVLAAAGDDAVVLLVASHGMGPYIGGYQLLEPVLQGLGLGPQRHAAAAAPSALPPGLRSVLRRVVPERLRFRRRVAAGGLHRREWLESPTCRVAPVENNRVGALRLNLVGREPHGCVHPGAEADALVAELRRELLALRAPGTDEPIVARVQTTEEVFGAERHPDLPDVLVVFRRDLGTLDACWSPRLGLVEKPVFRPTLPRTGDHTDESRLWAAGPGIEQGRELHDADVLDLGPTVLDLLEVPVPPDVDGHPLPLRLPLAPLGG